MTIKEYRAIQRQIAAIDDYLDGHPDASAVAEERQELRDELRSVYWGAGDTELTEVQ